MQPLCPKDITVMVERSKKRTVPPATQRGSTHKCLGRQPERIVVAVPMATPEACDEFRAAVGEVVCMITPHPFEWRPLVRRYRADDGGRGPQPAATGRAPACWRRTRWREQRRQGGGSTYVRD
jgi:hypothetical protein